MRNQINLSDDQIEEMFYRAFHVGLTVDDLVFDLATLEEFNDASYKYNACKKAIFGEIDGFETMVLGGAQVRKGDKRADLYIIDFGPIRACYR